LIEVNEKAHAHISEKKASRSSFDSNGGVAFGFNEFVMLGAC